MENVFRLGSLFSEMLATSNNEYYEPLEEGESKYYVCPFFHGSLRIVRNENDEFVLKCNSCEFCV